MKKVLPKYEGYLFILPWILGFLIFTLGPIIFSIYLSFSKWDMLTPHPQYIGLRNYINLFSDPDFLLSLRVTVIYTIFAVPLGMIGSLLVAMFLNQKLPGISIFRTVYYLPAVTSSVAMYLLWRWVLNPDYGIVNYILSSSIIPKLTLKGLEFIPLMSNPPGWLSEPNWALPSLILMNVWYLGGGMIIYLAGLQGIPEHLYEAAKLDGASPLQQFRHITVPMLSPTIFFNLTMAIIGSFKVFEVAYIMTGGGPAKATLFYVLNIYQNAFDSLKLGYAASMAWILFIIIVVLTAINFKLQKRWVYYD